MPSSCVACVACVVCLLTCLLSACAQMFERFLEERTANPTQPEVRFFDESIAAKLNRSKTNPIKKDTPFLNDLSDAHNQARDKRGGRESRVGGGGGLEGGRESRVLLLLLVSSRNIITHFESINVVVCGTHRHQHHHLSVKSKSARINHGPPRQIDL